MWKSDYNPMFRSQFSEDIFNQKYRHKGCETWDVLCQVLAFEVCDGLLPPSEIVELAHIMSQMKFIPGGRYLYYAGRPNKFYNNCYLLRAEADTREEWAALAERATTCLMTGGGIGIDYSIIRPNGAPILGTGGRATGPIALMEMINEIGRRVMQGGSRRSALYGSLNWQHDDAPELLHHKDWDRIIVPGTTTTVADVKKLDFNWPAPLDMTNISLNYDDEWLNQAAREHDATFVANVAQALRTGEPGFSFNFGEQSNETLRNACTEICSADDSDVCNLGSINLGRIESLVELAAVTELATKFLLCGTLRAKLPYQKVYDVREKNRRLGLGLMGIHEWLIQRGQAYQVTPELKNWLATYRDVSSWTARETADVLSISRPHAVRAIAPTGTIGILAGTSTGIEPIFAVAYKRRYLKGSSNWHYQYVVDGTAQELIERYAADPEKIESAIDLAADPERRIRFQADIQDYVDHAISSTINLPAWGSSLNNPDTVEGFANVLSKYAPRLRGFTVYPDGARGGQPLTPVAYSEAVDRQGAEYREEYTDICDLTQGGTCGS